MTTLRKRYMYFAPAWRRASRRPEDELLLEHDQQTCVVIGPAFTGTTELFRVRFEDGFEAEARAGELIETGGMASW